MIIKMIFLLDIIEEIEKMRGQGRDMD